MIDFAKLTIDFTKDPVTLDEINSERDLLNRELLFWKKNKKTSEFCFIVSFLLAFLFFVFISSDYFFWVLFSTVIIGVSGIVVIKSTTKIELIEEQVYLLEPVNLREYNEIEKALGQWTECVIRSIRDAGVAVGKYEEDAIKQAKTMIKETDVWQLKTYLATIGQQGLLRDLTNKEAGFIKRYITKRIKMEEDTQNAISFNVSKNKVFSLM